MKNFSFPKSAKLTQRDQFLRLFQEPVLFKGRVVLVFSKLRSDSEVKTRSRLGITIKGKLSSVPRARLKRTIREAFRVCLDKVPTDHNVLIRPPQKRLDETFFALLASDMSKWTQQRSRQ